MKTWIDRFAAEGEAGLVTRSSRPHTMPTKTSDEIEQKVLPLVPSFVRASMFLGR